MQRLIDQIIKFGIVGIICFFIDFGIVTVLTFLGVHYLIAGLCGFVISVIANYILSFKFVFERKEDLDRKKEFIIFVVLSAIGCGINELVMYICVDAIYKNVEWLSSMIPEKIAVLGSKIVATAIVMVYNFVTRKIFLEKKND